MAKAVFCTVKSSEQASQVVERLRTAGFTGSDISVLMPNKSGTKDFAVNNETKAPEGAATGAGAGALVGGGLGWLAGIGALAIPGLGPLIAAGPIMAALDRRGGRWHSGWYHGCSHWHGHTGIRSEEI